MLAFVLIALKECDEREVMDRLNKMKEVKEVHILFGEWDLIAKLEIKDAEALGTFVMQNVRIMPEIKITSTMIAAK